MRLLVAAMLGITVLAGCLSGNPFPRCDGDQWPIWQPGDATVRVCLNGRERTALLHVPAHVGAEVPLLLLLHGGGGSAEQVRQNTRMDDTADALGFAVLYAEGTPARAVTRLHTWNAVICCGRAFDRQVDDVRFLGTLVEDAARRYPIDATRIGVAGHSNGGMMAYRLAAERSDLFASVMPVAGSIGGRAEAGAPPQKIVDPEYAVSVLILHAIDDDHVPFDGGNGPASIDGPRIDLSVADAIQFWRDVNDAPGKGRPVARDEGFPEVHYGPGLMDTEVVLLATEGGHGWPGGFGGIKAPKIPDASAEIGAFLLAHPRARPPASAAA